MGQPMGKTYEQNVTEMVSIGMIAMAYESSWEVGRNDLCQMWLGNPRFRIEVFMSHLQRGNFPMLLFIPRGYFSEK